MIKEIKTTFEAARNIYKLDQTSWQAKVKELDNEGLLQELNRNRKLSNINTRLQQLEGAGELMGMAFLLSVGLRNEAMGVGGLLLGTALLHGRPGIVLNNRLQYLNLEMTLRRNKAIFYQDIPSLETLEALTSVLFP